MSLEESIQLLATEIKQLTELLKLNNALLIKLQVDPPIKTKRLLTEEDTAKYIGVSRSFLARDRMDGFREKRTKGPNPVRLGNKVMYDLEDLNKWIDDNKHIRNIP